MHIERQERWTNEQERHFEDPRCYTTDRDTIDAIGEFRHKPTFSPPHLNGKIWSRAAVSASGVGRFRCR